MRTKNITVLFVSRNDQRVLFHFKKRVDEYIKKYKKNPDLIFVSDKMHKEWVDILGGKVKVDDFYWRQITFYKRIPVINYKIK